MNADTNWHQVGRIAWLPGGLVAINNPGPVVEIGAGIDGRLLGRMQLPTYDSLIAVIQHAGFRVVGVTYVHNADEARRIYPPQFRAFSPGNGWLLWDLHQRWRQIAVASSELDEMRLMDIASRVAGGLAYSELRLFDLAEAYGIQLRGRCHTGKADRYVRFKDANGFAVYKAIHALFWEMAVLRDVLAEYAAQYCFSRAGVTTLSGLVRSLRKNQSDDPLVKELLAAADDANNGWLATFTAYRNLFTHCAPMEQVAGTAFVVQEVRAVAGGTFPSIYYPLPANVPDLMRRRSSGESLFETYSDMVNASAGRRHDRTSEPDALEYLCDCLDSMAKLCRQLAERSPVDAKPIEIGPDDMIGGVQIIRR